MRPQYGPMSLAPRTASAKSRPTDANPDRHQPPDLLAAIKAQPGKLRGTGAAPGVNWHVGFLGMMDSLKLDPRSFFAGVDRVATIATEKTRAVKMALDTDRVTLSVTSPDNGTAAEEVPALHDGPPARHDHAGKAGRHAAAGEHADFGRRHLVERHADLARIDRARIERELGRVDVVAGKLGLHVRGAVAGLLELAALEFLVQFLDADAARLAGKRKNLVLSQ